MWLRGHRMTKGTLHRHAQIARKWSEFLKRSWRNGNQEALIYSNYWLDFLLYPCFTCIFRNCCAFIQICTPWWVCSCILFYHIQRQNGEPRRLNTKAWLKFCAYGTGITKHRSMLCWRLDKFICGPFENPFCELRKVERLPGLAM